MIRRFNEVIVHIKNYLHSQSGISEESIKVSQLGHPVIRVLGVGSASVRGERW